MVVLAQGPEIKYAILRRGHFNEQLKLNAFLISQISLNLVKINDVPDIHAKTIINI